MQTRPPQLPQQPYRLAALVRTAGGEGFIVGRNLVTRDFRYRISLLAGGTVDADQVVLVDEHPIDHPALPPGMRTYLLDREQHTIRT